MQLHKIEYFRVLARTGSFVRAAHELNISQPALSRSIQSLESELGVSLLRRVRGRGGLTLTPDGIRLLSHADALLARVELIEQEFALDTHRAQRELSFGLGPMLAGFALGRTLPGIIRDHPDVRINVVVDSAREAIDGLLQGRIEFHVGYALPRSLPPRVVRHDFLTVAPRILVHRDHPLAKMRTIDVTALKRYPLVSGTAWNENLAGEAEDLRRALTALVQIDNQEVLIELVRSTDAVLMGGFFPADLGPGLVALPAPGRPPSSRIFVYSLNGVRISPIGQRVLADIAALQARSLDPAAARAPDRARP